MTNQRSETLENIMPDRATGGQYLSLRQNPRSFAAAAKCEGWSEVRHRILARLRKELDWPCYDGKGKATIPPRNPVRSCRKEQDATHENRRVDIAHENGNLRVGTLLLRCGSWPRIRSSSVRRSFGRRSRRGKIIAASRGTC